MTKGRVRTCVYLFEHKHGHNSRCGSSSSNTRRGGAAPPHYPCRSAAVQQQHSSKRRGEPQEEDRAQQKKAQPKGAGYTVPAASNVLYALHARDSGASLEEEIVHASSNLNFEVSVVVWAWVYGVRVLGM